MQINGRIEAISRRVSRRRGAAAVAAVMAVASAALAARAAGPPAGGEQTARQAQVQQAIRNQDRRQAAIAGTRITFQITQGTDYNARSRDQITIVFSDRSWVQASTPPVPLFGEDIAQEFSFSAADFDRGSTLTFSRIVRDTSFLSSRYIRVLNHGEDGWGAGTISMSVNGQPVLSNVPMRPLRGDPTEGLQGANRLTWRTRTYWEAELAMLRRKSSY